MLVIENINRLLGKHIHPLRLDEYIDVYSIDTSTNDTYEIHFKHSALDWVRFTYVIHRDMQNGYKYVGTLRYTRKGRSSVGGSHREDCLNTRLKRMDMFLEFLNVLVEEWLAKIK